MVADDAGAEGSASASAAASGPQNQATSEALACVSCRSRKLKCDRTKPACTRCEKVNNECVYPESRRKPAFKRRNVRELEARLAQVEVLLQDATKSTLGLGPEGSGRAQPPEEAGEEEGDGGGGSGSGGGGVSPEGPEFAPVAPMMTCSYSMGIGQEGGDFDASQLIGLGMSEVPPPFEVIEELHEAFFERQQMFIPIIHPTRYLKQFHSAPHLRPPMCLQYSVWAMAANGHPKYNAYHDALYKRARQYLEADELRGQGEHFISISHAQAWVLVATYEGRCMNFTRAAMSGARAVRLVHMMGLHRLDDEGTKGEAPPTVAPPADWTELEERRRVLWGAFCIDSHCGISTGWPVLLDYNDVTTHLPCSEDAFNQGKEEKSCRIGDAFNGHPYSTFAGTVLICHIFNRILKHVHMCKPDDRPEDVDYGGFWNRHREIDTILSSAFMFLPDMFRIPKNIYNPIAVQTNLNLHASVICLHNAACDKTDKHKLPAHVKKISQDRRLMAAQEIVNIMKLSSHIKMGYRSPLVALSLYCATSVFISQARDKQEHCDVSSLEFLVNCMDAIGKEHIITRAFLQQAILDIQRNGISTNVTIPWLDRFSETMCGHNIPLLARSSVSAHSKVQPPLPGRLPLGNPLGNAFGRHTTDCCPTDSWASAADDLGNEDGSGGGASRSSNKRRRMKSPEPSSATTTATTATARTSVSANTPATSSPFTWKCAGQTGTSSLSGAGLIPTGVSYPGGASHLAQVRLPHRGGSSASSPSAARDSPSTQGASSTDTPAVSRVGTEPSTLAATDPSPASMDTLPDQLNMDLFAGIDSWDLTDGSSMYAQLVEAVRTGTFGAPGDSDPWVLPNDGDGSWDAGGGLD